MMILTQPAAIKAMLAVDRKNYVQSESPYQESALPIGTYFSDCIKERI